MSVLCFKMTVKKQHLKKLLHPNNLLDSKSVHPTLTTTYLKLRCYQRKSKWSATLLILLCQLTLTALIALLKYPWCLMMTSLCNRQRVPQTARLNIAVAQVLLFTNISTMTELQLFGLIQCRRKTIMKKTNLLQKTSRALTLTLLKYSSYVSTQALTNLLNFR